MRLRHVCAPALIAALAVAPLAASTAAAADDHAKTYVDTDTGAPASSVDITKVKVLTTATDYRAVVSYKAYARSKATRYSIGIGVNNGAGESGNVLDLRIAPTGKVSLLAYGVTDGDRLVKSYCHGNRVFSGRSTLTFVIAKHCFYSTSSPARVIAGTYHYASAAAYAKGSPADPYLTSQETSDNDIFRSSLADGWDWGGPAAEKPGTRAPFTRLHL